MSTEESLILQEIQNIKRDVASLRDEFNEKLGQTNEQVNRLLVRVEQSLARQEEVCRNGIAQRSEHHRTLYGNGLNEPGLVSVVQDHGRTLGDITKSKDANKAWLYAMAASIILLLLDKGIGLISAIAARLHQTPPP